MFKLLNTVFLFAMLCLPAFGQVQKGAATRQFTGVGAPSAGSCSGPGDIGKLYVRRDQPEAYDCLFDGSSSYSWVERGSGGGGGGGVTLGYMQSGQAVYCAAVDESDTFTCSLETALTEYTVGMVLEFVSTVTANTGAATVNVNGLGAIPIVKSDGSTTPDNGDIAIGVQTPLRYDGVSFRLPSRLSINLVTTIGTPGSDSNVPTEQAVRELADALVIASGTPEVQVDGTPVATNAFINFIPGTGLIITPADTGGITDLQVDFDDSVIMTQAIWQAGQAIYATDVGGDDTYAFTLTPPLLTYSEGQMFVIKVSTANTGASTVNFNSLGAKSLKESDGTTDATITVGVPYLIVYDGTLFRKVGGGSSGGTSVDRTAYSWSSTSGTNFTASQTSYVSLSGGSANGAETNRRTIFPKAGTLSDIWFKTSGTQHATGDLVCTVFVNGTTDTSIVTTFTAGSSTTVWSDTTHTAHVNAGDFASLKCVNGASGGASLSLLNLGILFTFD